MAHFLRQAQMTKGRTIGTSVARREGPSKVTGRAAYTDDKTFRCLLHGATVRSTVARGRLLAIHYGEGIPWDEFTIVTAKDIEGWGGLNRVEGLAEDQPFLVEEMINHADEPVVLLAHPDRALLEKARRAVTLEVEERPAVLDLDASLAADPVVGGVDNCFKEIWIRKGDPDPVWAGAAHVVEGTYRTGAQEHLYLETNGMLGIVAHGDLKHNVTVCGSLQCPYYVHKALKALFNVSDAEIRVVQMETGGAFGGKEDYPSILAGHAAMLAWKSHKPVKLLYDREEDMVATTKRHPSRTRIRSAFDDSGRLLALDIDFLLDGGAYTTLSPVVLSRGAIHAAGPYRCPHVRVHARAMATNHPPRGAFRGFGAPQSLFAMERHMDAAARAMGLDPVALRRRNVLRTGDTMATGQVYRESLDLERLMDLALEDLEAGRKREAWKASPDKSRRGIGLSLFMHGAGFTGSGEARLASVAGVEGTLEGHILCLSASTEMGQGKDTLFTQIVADTLGIPLDLVEVAQPDTRVVPDSGPTVASRTTMVVGRLLQDAALSLKQVLIQHGILQEPYTADAFQDAVRTAHARFGTLKAYSQYTNPPHLEWDEQAYRGDAYPTYGWACQAAEVSVDPVTWEVKVEDFVSVQEVGRVLNPFLAQGQVEGGVAQGIGYALLEEVKESGGRMVNRSMTDYLMATSLDLPRIRTRFLETPTPSGPCGAKGLGELPMDGPAPAILNAVQDALGVDVRVLPLTPERLLEAVEALEVAHG
jgi:CO/xanthine dehydrogenase Mo-binding subunit